jgi:hypothetical protein
MRLAVIAAALAAAALAACGDKPPQPRVDAQPAAAGGTSAASGTSAATSSSTGQASKEERKDGANPVQQQVDPKQKEQRRDFQMRGDQQGPNSAETQPKN